MFKFIISIVAMFILFIAVGPIINLEDEFGPELRAQKMIVYDAGEVLTENESSINSIEKAIVRGQEDLERYKDEVETLRYELELPINLQMKWVYQEVWATAGQSDNRSMRVRNFIKQNEVAYFNYCNIQKEFDQKVKLVDIQNEIVANYRTNLVNKKNQLAENREETRNLPEGEQLLSLFDKGYSANTIVDETLYKPLHKANRKYDILAFSTIMSFMFLTFCTPFGYVVMFILGVAVVGKITSNK